MSYVYICSERGSSFNEYKALYTVGFYDPEGKWQPESDWSDKEVAAERVHFLNGGDPKTRDWNARR
jgi:hypothetical protein